GRGFPRRPLLRAGLPGRPLRPDHHVALPGARLRPVPYAGDGPPGVAAGRPAGDRGAAVGQPDVSAVPRALARPPGPATPGAVLEGDAGEMPGAGRLASRCPPALRRVPPLLLPVRGRRVQDPARPRGQPGDRDLSLFPRAGPVVAA